MSRGGNARHRDMRADELDRWSRINAPCGICGMADIDWTAPANTPDAFEVDHKLPVITYPHLEFEPTNRQPSHHRCNRNKGSGKSRVGIGITSEPW
jgi:5-methylcytosine-specific restriction endonuclease McrA